MSIRLQILQNKHKVIHTNKTTWNYVKLIKKVTSKWFLFLNFKKNFRNLKNLFQHFSLTLIERILIILYQSLCTVCDQCLPIIVMRYPTNDNIMDEWMNTWVTVLFPQCSAKTIMPNLRRLFLWSHEIQS